MPAQKRRPLVRTAKKALSGIAEKLRAELEEKTGRHWDLAFEDSSALDSGYSETAFVTDDGDGYSLHVEQWGRGVDDFSVHAGFHYEYDHGASFRDGFYSSVSYHEVKKYTRLAANQIVKEEMS